MMVVFGVLVALIFGLVAKESNTERLKYGLKVFVEFIGIGIILGWLLYFLPL